MQRHDAQGRIAEAIGIAHEMNPQDTDGAWLEALAVQMAPYIKEWDVDECWGWADWPDRELHYPSSTRQDVGIDAVAVRHDGRQYIAIQCKARHLDAMGRGASIAKVETDKFRSTSSVSFWAERWIVTNGDVSLSDNIGQSLAKGEKPIKLVNIVDDLRQEQQAAPVEEPCPHCESNPEGEWRRRTRSCMQNEAVAESVGILGEHAQSTSDGQARGKIILPCGTGKTRISLRIVEELTPPGELSIVLCPSIALVAQIRREYLQHAQSRLRALAVCSDETAGYDPKKEGARDTSTDPTVDNSNVGASVVKGKVTTDAGEIAKWISDGKAGSRVSVIFGTYQSGARVAEALRQSGVTARVLICDEAHRTAGLRRKKSARTDSLSPAEQRVRDFTLCHDADAFPATYRVYQTATPRVYDEGVTRRVNHDPKSDWFVRSMDDERTFGVELYRKSYGEAVENGWLADYRIIAVAIQGEDANNVANELAQQSESTGRNRLATPHYLRGLAFTLAMGGATTQGVDGSRVPIKSCIAFMNTVDKSKNMAKDLQDPKVRDWLRKWLEDRDGSTEAAAYSLEHLDATSNVAQRENGKRRLAAATEAEPHGIINVGIFGEGTDSPSLSAVAFLEPRKSPIDVIQAVGRAMRTAPDKSLGYIICPIVIPPYVDAENWLTTSSPDEGWQELGQILRALRAHDQRIEDNLSSLLQLYIPKIPEKVSTFIGIVRGESKRIEYYTHEGGPGDAEEAVTRTLEGAPPHRVGFVPVPREFAPPAPPNLEDVIGKFPEAAAPGGGDVSRVGETTTPYGAPSPDRIITGKRNNDDTFELRQNTVVREKPNPDGAPGILDIPGTKKRAKGMINNGAGVLVPPKPKRTPEQIAEAERQRQEREKSRQLRLLEEMREFGDAIRMNLLEKSGLTADRVSRDLNILRECVNEAAHHLNADELGPALDRHFGLDNLKESDLNKQADGCTIAALLMMNAAMLHQRIANGQWLSGVSDLAAIKNDVNVVRRITREWNAIARHDFLPVVRPAVEAIEAVEDTGKLNGLARALHHIAAEAERIAETYADMGADHAGPLFNRVMGNQASDGAFFTRPVAASLAARLTLDACDGDVDWTDPAVWRDHKTADLACGSGTLLAAMLADMKRRARARGATVDHVAALQKLAVEETIAGLDINPVSLQLAAAQLTAGNQNVGYRQMQLHQMPYGPERDNPSRVAAGTLELLGQQAIIARRGQMDLGDDAIGSQSLSMTTPPQINAELEPAVAAVRDTRIVIMNPPFTNRANMGQKFPKETQERLRARADALERTLVQADPDLMGFMDKNSIGPLFVALADHVVKRTDGVVAMINPTIALSSASGMRERQVLADRFHIHTVVTCHQPGNINMSQNTNINESIIVMRRHSDGPKPSTRFVHLDRIPADESEVDDLHAALLNCPEGMLANGWGEVSHWPAERMSQGDWAPAIWRSPELAEAATAYANRPDLQALGNLPGVKVNEMDRALQTAFERTPESPPPLGSIPILKSKGSEGQHTITSTPDEYWVPKKRDEALLRANGGTYPEADKIVAKSAYLLITDSQRNSTARLTATASNDAHVGVSWMPVTGLGTEEAKAMAVFFNCTSGRVQLMSHGGRTIEFPMYRPASVKLVHVPDVTDSHIRETLAACWELTKDMVVPQYRDGECEARRLWDEAVAEALGWDAEELTRLRHLLHNEPHVRGLGNGQYADETEDPEGVGDEIDNESTDDPD